MRLFNLITLSPLASDEPATPRQVLVAAAPWALVAGVALACLFVEGVFR
ncbi:hypothetical protein GVN21_10195 [Caulobacter sp. SLTY]|nr:hypothetical protein [Caulobacter sp. SLTY]NBB15724.1 hypothetical protein [Caulobacter sp. SLTY]